jgi:2-keto-3-deoxy-L-rhamnonate aldolase RhmA
MSPFAARLAGGDIALGCNVRFARSAEIGPMLAQSGFHWIMLDQEHSPVAPHLAYDIALAAIRAGVTPLARPAGHDPAQIAALLTNGALGLLAPHVETPAQAAAVARAARFAPEGRLSVPGTLPHFGYAVPLPDACVRFNAEVTVIAMIESRAAVAQAEAIAATPGIDGLFIGASDLLWDAGAPGDYAGPVLADAVTKITAAARNTGKFCGMGGPKDDRVWRGFLAQGMRLILTENDLSLLLRGARDRAAYFASLRG